MMDRGFGSSFSRNNTGNNRFSRDDRRYDDYYGGNRRSGGGQAGNARNSGNRNNAQNNRGGGGWGNSSNRDRGFFNQGNNARGNNYGGQIVAALQQQQHNLLTAFMNNQNAARNMSRFPQGNRGGRPGNNRPAVNNRPVDKRAGDKRRQDNNQGGGNFKRNRKSNQATPSGRSSASSTPKTDKKTESKTPKTLVVEEPDIPDDEVVIPDSLMDSVERLRQRTDIDRNVADEDVQKLVVFLFTGKGYQCQTCGILLSKEEGFKHHLMGKSHVMSVIDSRTAKKYQNVREILDIDLSPDDWFEKNQKAKDILFKQAKLLMKAQREIERRERENYEKEPKNFYTVKMASRKSAMKRDEGVVITSLCESTIEIKDFEHNRFFGCEFVKAVTAFNCRLCHIQIKEASEVIPHVNSKVHKNNYQMHVNRNKGYEENQREQNKDLLEVLTQYEENNVLLFESSNASETMFLSQLDAGLIRDEKVLNPQKPAPKEDPKKSEAKEKEPEIKADESATEKKEEEKPQEAAEEESNKEETEDVNKEEESEEQVDDETTEKEKDVEMENSEEPIEENNAEEKQEVEDANKEEETEEKVEEVEDEKAKPAATKKTPGSARGRGGKRGRGRGAKGTPSPRSRRAAANKLNEEQEEHEGSFMDSFKVVDEVDDDQ